MFCKLMDKIFFLNVVLSITLKTHAKLPGGKHNKVTVDIYRRQQLLLWRGEISSHLLMLLLKRGLMLIKNTVMIFLKH